MKHVYAMWEHRTSEVGGRIRDRRVELGMSQRDLGWKIGHTGNANISAIETGRRGLSLAMLFEIAQALDCKPEDFLR